MCVAAAALAIACDRSPAAVGGDSRSDSTAANVKEKSTSAAEASAPQWRDVVLPAGTTLPVALDTAVGSDTSRIEDSVART
jgi:type IV secretory pathway VirB10-like protein